MLDQLPRKPRCQECGVVNLDKHTGPGTHWVAYFKNRTQNEYFDSFGNLQPPQELVNYLGSNINYNYTKYQNFNSVNCGHLCLKFLYEMNKIK